MILLMYSSDTVSVCASDFGEQEITARRKRRGKRNFHHLLSHKLTSYAHASIFNERNKTEYIYFCTRFLCLYYVRTHTRSISYYDNLL